LITVNVLVDKKKIVKGVYDSGSNITLINQKIVDELKTKLMNDHNLFRTISGVNFTNRRAKIPMKINKIEEILDVYVVKNNNFSYDLLLGLDAIKKFKLIQNENLEILQKVDDKTDVERLNYESSVFSVNMESNLNYLDTEKRQTITRLIEGYESLFAKHKYDVGEVKHAEAEIKLSEDILLRSHTERVSQIKKK